MKLFLKRLFKITGVALLVLIILGFLLVDFIDRTPLKQLTAYQETMQSLEDSTYTVLQGDNPIKAGWAAVNITPNYPAPLAGYGIRKEFSEVNDSLFVRAVVFEKDKKVYAMVSYDLMVVPKVAIEKITGKLPFLAPHHLYLSATHTHSGYGGWEGTFLGQVITGFANETTIEMLSKATQTALEKAYASRKAISMEYGTITAPQYVNNRLSKGKKDDGLRFVRLRPAQGPSAIITTYAAHPTNINKKLQILSGDYPGILMAQLESSPSIDFALFAAGMVGSHSPNYNIGGKDIPRAKKIGEGLANLLIEQMDSVAIPSKSSGIGMIHFPVHVHEAQFRIDQDLRIRHTVFNLLTGGLTPKVSAFQVGDLFFMGMPCDFSGEIYLDHSIEKIAQDKGLFPIVTSFNGEYIGYIIPDKYYDTVKKHETREMNWFGPYQEEYFVSIMEKILSKWPSTQ
ncbi:neutral/alkaline non-lysosomal ceramidase N-terminal domain-containing protein [Algivirga pacifica]